jgi:hypothetical protein
MLKISTRWLGDYQRLQYSKSAASNYKNFQDKIIYSRKLNLSPAI